MIAASFSIKDTQDLQGGIQITDCKDATISYQIFILEKSFFCISED